MSNVDTIFHFAQGIPGFEQLKKFEFEDIGADIPMKLMRSVGEQEVSLLVASPFIFYPEYEWELADSIKKELGISNEKDVEVWSIITIPDDPAAATINLLAPIVLNRTTKLGKQLIIHDHTYSSRAPLNR